MNVLELFCGTKSVGKCCEQLGWNSISVDMDKKFKPTHLCNILDFDYKQYPKDYFSLIWGSPPCVSYSQLKKCWYGRKLKSGIIYNKELHDKEMDYADIIMAKTLEIINYFNCDLWFIENPLSPLKKRDIMKGIPMYEIDYCMYSDWGYKKRTCIWTNKKDWVGLQCDGSGACGNMMEKQHTSVLGNGYEIIDGKKVLVNTKAKRDKMKQQNLHKERMGTSKTIKDGDKIIRCNTAELRKKYKDYPNMQKYGLHGTTLEQRYRVPEDLIYSLFLD